MTTGQILSVQSCYQQKETRPTCQTSITSTARNPAGHAYSTALLDALSPLTVCTMSMQSKDSTVEIMIVKSKWFQTHHETQQLPLQHATSLQLLLFRLGLQVINWAESCFFFSSAKVSFACASSNSVSRSL